MTLQGSEVSDLPCRTCGSKNHGTGAHDVLERQYARELGGSAIIRPALCTFRGRQGNALLQERLPVAVILTPDMIRLELSLSLPLEEVAADVESVHLTLL